MQNLSSENKNYFHKKVFALGLVLRVRVFGTQTWLTGMLPWMSSLFRGTRDMDCRKSSLES